MTIDEKTLQEIEARANAASEGPWNVVRDGLGSDCDVRGIKHDHAGPFDEDNLNRRCSACQFIAHARTDIPALIAALREAWRERDSLKTEANARNSTRLGARVVELETALREIADFGKCEPVLYGNDEWFVNIARRAIGERKP